MRLAYVTETYPPEVNGVALTAARTVAWLRRRGHEVQLVRPRQGPTDTPGDDNAWCTAGWPIPMYPELRIGLSLPSTLQARWRRAGTQLVHVATQGSLGWVAVSAARRLGLPVTADFRTNFHQYAGYYGLGWTAPVVQAYLRRFHARTRLNFVPTWETAEALSQAGFGHLQVLGRGVDVHQFSPSWRSASLRGQWVLGDAPVLLLVGRLAAEKNVVLALRAARLACQLIPGAATVVVGDGPLRASLMREFPQAHFVGTQSGNALARHYASADLFLFPSLSDTFGNVTLEAMASGLAVVAYDTAAAGEHITDRVNGRLARRGDEVDFIAATCHSTVHLGELRALRVRARSTAITADWSGIHLAFEQHLEGVLDAQQTPTRELAIPA